MVTYRLAMDAPDGRVWYTARIHDESQWTRDEAAAFTTHDAALIDSIGQQLQQEHPGAKFKISGTTRP